MFDFPASPAIGDFSNGFVFNGTGWAGGPAVTTPSEQFFDLGGKSQIDIVVPSWAKGVQFDGSTIQTAINCQPAIQLSFDGSTFITAANYAVAGPFHGAGGATPYATQAQVSVTSMIFAWGTDNLAMPANFTGTLNLVIASPGSQIIALRSVSTNYMTSASQPVGNRTNSILSYYNATPPSAAVKAIRFLNSGAAGNFATSSWLKVKWLGDAPPQGNALVAPPSDNVEYVMVNGLWRKKCETFTWSSRLNTKGINCPAGATRLTTRIFVSNAVPQAAGTLGFQASQDGGATWLTASGAYYYYGMSADAGNANAVNVVAQANTYGLLGWMTNNTSVGSHSTTDFALVRNGASTQAWHSVGGGYYDTTNFGRTWVVNGYASAGFTGAPINALLFFLANSNMDGGSIECTWGYG